MYDYLTRTVCQNSLVPGMWGKACRDASVKIKVQFDHRPQLLCVAGWGHSLASRPSMEDRQKEYIPHDMPFYQASLTTVCTYVG